MDQNPERMEEQRGKIIGADTRTLTFRGDELLRTIDLEISMHATQDDLVFEAFKDGFVGIRTHPHLRLTPQPQAWGQGGVRKGP